jgi:hypothetical protein
MEIRPKIWQDLTKSGNQFLGTAKTQNQKKSDVWRWRSTMEIDMMCGGGDRRDVWRGGGAASWRRGSLEAVAAWQLGRHCGVEVWLAGRGRTK